MGIRFKKNKMQFLLLMLLGFIHSCIDYRVNDRIDFEREITMGVNKIKGERGVLIMNNKFMLSSSCPLVYHKNFPSWIIDNDPDLIYTTNEYVFKPAICDIPIPYKLIKKKNTDFFEIIKFKDTLTFKIIEF